MTVSCQEEKTPCQRKFPYADFSETYGTLLNYFTDTASGDAIFLYREEASLSHAPFGYEYHVVQYQKSTDAYEESALVFPENTLLLSVCLSPNGYLLLFISRKRFHNLPFLS